MQINQRIVVILHKLRVLAYHLSKVALFISKKLFGTKRYKKIVLICAPRTGSNLLMSYLNTHPKIKMKGELFNFLEGDKIDKKWNHIFNKELPWIKYLGFKLFYLHPHDAKPEEKAILLDKILADEKIYIIHLRRRNKLRTYLSHEIAKRSDIWVRSKVKGQLSLENKRFTVDLDQTVEYIESVRKLEDEFSKKISSRNHSELFYEDYIFIKK
ncbi:MAG: hypothetical protein AAFY41_01550, partial [Bacteroidota bacterium]